MKLPDNTTDRMLMVADRIEFEPEKWDQSYWIHLGISQVFSTPESLAGSGDETGECGTSFCVAGWAVKLTPRDQIEQLGHDDAGCLNRGSSGAWQDAGAAALGLTYACASELFSGFNPLRTNSVSMADALRRLAKCAEPRSLEDWIKSANEAVGREVYDTEEGA